MPSGVLQTQWGHAMYWIACPMDPQMDKQIEGEHQQSIITFNIPLPVHDMKAWSIWRESMKLAILGRCADDRQRGLYSLTFRPAAHKEFFL